MNIALGVGTPSPRGADGYFKIGSRAWASVTLPALAIGMDGLPFTYSYMKLVETRHVEVKESEVLRLIRIDEMTGLYNRVYFLDRVRDDMLRSERYGWPLSLLILSVDRFDEIRNQYGQIISDNVAVTVAGMIRKFARNTDIVGRVETARFTLLLPGTSGEGAETIAERLHNRITSHLFSTRAGDPIHVTCSLGVAEFQDNYEQVADFVQAAESALLQSESAGGDRWTSSSRSGPAKFAE